MAAKMTTKPASLLKCPTCLATLTEPRALQCFHLFCQRCIADMKLEEESTYECPVCERATAKDNVQPIACISELLEVVNSGKTDGMRCDKCKAAKTAIWRCNDCKQNFCDACYKGHNEYAFMENHRWDKISGETHAVLDKHVYCQRHPQKLVELHCKDCKQLICMLCNGTEHKTHDAETIEEAAAKVVPSIREKKTKMVAIIKENEKVLEDTTVQGEEVKKNYEDLEKEIDRKCDEIMRKAREDCNEVQKQLKAEKDEEFGKIEIFRKQLEVKIQSQQNTVALCDTTLTTAQGTSLLQILQSGVGDSMDTSIDESTEIIKSREVTLVKFTEASLPNGNLIGNISKQSPKECKISDAINRSLTDMSKMNPTLLREIMPASHCLKFVRVGSELWFLKDGTNAVDVYSLDSNRLRSVQYKQLECIKSFTTLGSGLVLAASNGAHIADLNGVVKQKVIEGDICDISLKGNMLYVLDDGAGKVHVFNLHDDGKTTTKQSDFTIQNYVSNSWNTIQVTEDNIYVALVRDHKIIQYSNGGVVKAEFTSCDASVGQQLVKPKLCGVDTEGSLLVVRRAKNSSVLILTADGQWVRLPITGLTRPLHAYVEDDTLWVYEWYKNSCQQYVFK